MSGPDLERLSRVLGSEDTARLRSRLRERMARGLDLSGSISLSDPSPAERGAIDRLLGRRAGTGRSVTVPLGALDSLLRTSQVWPEGLASAVVALTGPVTVRSEARSAEDEAWERALAPLVRIAGERPELRPWLDGLVSGGLLRRLTGTAGAAARTVEQACRAIESLPTKSPVPAGEFATTILGGAHTLDDGTPVATLVFGAARAMSGMPAGTGARWRRLVWESVGLVRDQLTSTVLTVGLTAARTTATGRTVTDLSANGHPAVLTLRQLRADTPGWFTRSVVSVCENPSVVAAAADSLGASTGPLVCTSGQPGAAVMLLLDQLRATGAALRYHGDFDWYGVSIANHVRRHHDWTPWHFSAADYRRAARVHAGDAIRGSVVAASWDNELAPAMRAIGIQVEEEAVLAELLDDLAQPLA
ncbi:TIGR02679 family protein [Tsukamurella sp. PLM1]|uniref:TIGR02679 family protein n=1 Tax=Tsukamurella sp. PLM1 TaxID=2929795 RepID=UPI002049C98C|nr:TIGR02679 family protein [Tsukamurella sp. PLM1]BDH57953.1 hypothetical protein MTP03_28920 [Tsukamurella sp. PLM1]